MSAQSPEGQRPNWDLAFRLWEETTMPYREIVTMTGVRGSELHRRTSARHYKDPTYPSGRDRCRARAIEKLSSEEALNEPGRIGQVRRVRARRYGLDAPLRKPGPPAPPADLLAALDAGLAEKKTVKEIAAGLGTSPSRLYGILERRRRTQARADLGEVDMRRDAP